MAVRSARSLLPYRDYDEHDVLNLYALNGTGQAGSLVKATSLNPANAYFYTTTSVGATFPGITSYRWVNPDTCSNCGSGDGKWSSAILGLTLVNVMEYDENGNRLITYPTAQRKLAENNGILSGLTVPIATKGIFMINTALVTGTPAIGQCAVVTYSQGAAKINQTTILGCVPWTNVASGYSLGQFPAGGSGIYTEDQVIGRWLSTTGYWGTTGNTCALLKLEL